MKSDLLLRVRFYFYLKNAQKLLQCAIFFILLQATMTI